MNANKIIGCGKQMLIALALMGACATAPAAMIAYEDVGFLRGTASATQAHGDHGNAFVINQTGTYKATLTDFKFPNAFTSEFGLQVVASNESVGAVNGAGSFTFDATAGTTYWALVFGETAGRLNLGAYGVRIEQIALAPVPVPGGLLLLASAVVAFVGFGRGGMSPAGGNAPDGDALVAA